MELKSVVKMLEESQGMNISNIYIPTYGESAQFKPLTTGQQKSISKLTWDTDDEYDPSEEFLKIALYDTLCLDNEKYSSSKLTEVDMLAFYAGLRLQNISSPLSITVTCDKCEKDFTVVINLEDIIEGCKKYERDEVKFEKVYNKITYTFILGDPSFKTVAEFEQYIHIVNESNIIKSLDDYRLFTTPIKYIKYLAINGEEITDFHDSSFSDKLSFYEMLPGDITLVSTDQEKKDSLLDQVINKFSNERMNKIFKKLSCPHCRNKMGGVISYDNFFTI